MQVFSHLLSNAVQKFLEKLYLTNSKYKKKFCCKFQNPGLIYSV